MKKENKRSLRLRQKVLVLTGGHAGSTADAVTAEIKRRKLGWGVTWIGEDQIRGKIQTVFTSTSILDLVKIPFGFLKSFAMLGKIKPDLVLSFGGSSGSLVSFAAYLLGIPVIIHEQTASVGRGNRITSKFAKKIAISREASRSFFPKEKTVLTGNPINADIIKLGGIPPRQRVETIFVTGGSRGSEKINEALVKILPSLLKKYNVIHQTGEAHVHKYPSAGAHHQVSGRVDMYKSLKNSDIVVGRAGANTVSEIIAAKKPCILIPIPWSYMDEQTKNAQNAEGLGIARILPQSELSPERLLKEIEKLVEDYPEIIKKIDRLVSPDIHASEKLVDLIEGSV